MDEETDNVSKQLSKMLIDDLSGRLEQATFFFTYDKPYTFSPVELSSERGEKEVLADSNSLWRRQQQPMAPLSTKSYVSYCPAHACRREKIAAEGTSSTTGRALLQPLLVSAVDSCHCPYPPHRTPLLSGSAPHCLTLTRLMHPNM